MRQISQSVNNNKKVVGILGKGEIGHAMARLCEEAGYKVLIRELYYDQLNGVKVNYLHVNIPEKDNKKFIKIVVKNIKELKPNLTIINSTTSPHTAKKIYLQTKSLIVHSPVIGIHPYIYESIKFYFPKIIGPTTPKSLLEAKKHLHSLGLKTVSYKSSDESETAKLLDLTYYAWNILFCKWVFEVCQKMKLNFEDVYTKHNNIYNTGYKKLFPNVLRPVLIPTRGPVGGHCTIPDVEIFHKHLTNRFTKFILDENNGLKKAQTTNASMEKEFNEIRSRVIKKNR